MTAGACVPVGPSCHGTCLTCSGTLETECLTCTLPRVLSGDNYCCDLSDGYMLEAVTNNCIQIPCDATCLTCTGTDANHCATCTAPRVLSADNYCCDVTNGYELEFGTNNCILTPPVCHGTCLTCIGTEADECSSCTLPRVLSADNICCDVSNGYKLQNVTNFCVVDTPIICHGTCLTCSGTASNECLTCAGPRLISGDNYCCDVANGYELQAVTNNCILTPGTCEPGCSLCDATISSGECLDEIIPKLEDNTKVVNRCFKMDDYFANKDFCKTQDMVTFHSEVLKSDFQSHIFITSFTGLSEEYLNPLFSFLTLLSSDLIKQYV